MPYPQAFVCVPTKKSSTFALLLGKGYAKSEVTNYDDIQLANITSHFYGYDGNTVGKKHLRPFYESATKLQALLGGLVGKVCNFKELKGVNLVVGLVSTRLTKVDFN
jgi:hypothetical protein